MVARVPWADLRDSSEGELSDTESSSSSCVDSAIASAGEAFPAPLPGVRELLDQHQVVGSRAASPLPLGYSLVEETAQVVHRGEHKPCTGISSTTHQPEIHPGLQSSVAANSEPSYEARHLGPGESPKESVSALTTGLSGGLSHLCANRDGALARGRSPTRRVRFSPQPMPLHGIGSRCRSLSHGSYRCSPQPVLECKGQLSSLHLPRQLGPRAFSLPPLGSPVHQGGSGTYAGVGCPAEVGCPAKAGGGGSPGRKENEKLSCKEDSRQRPRVDGKRSKSVPEQVGGEPVSRSEIVQSRDLDHSLLNYDMTLGYPGEGPVPGPKTPPKETTPRTPPKDARPRTPPKSKRPTPPKGSPHVDSSFAAPVRGSSSSGSIPPWTQDLEEEVRGLWEYLARSPGNAIASVTESRRTLGPPKAKVSRPIPPVPPPPRVKAKAGAIAPPSKGIAAPKPAQALQPPPPPKPRARDRQEEVAEPRVVKAKFDSGFSYQDARKQAAVSTSSMEASYAHVGGLPDIRPLVPFNPAGHLSQQVGEAAEVSKVAFPTEAPEKARGYARPTPKVKTARLPDNSLVGIESPQTVVTSTEQACAGERTGNVATSVPEREPETEVQDPTPADVSQSTDKETILAPSGTGELSSSSNDLEVRPSLTGVSGENNRPEPANPKVPYPVGEGESVVVTRPELTDPKVFRPLGEEKAIGDSRLESADHRASQAPVCSPDNKISYEVTIKVLANSDNQRTRLLTLSSTHAGLFCNQLIVHGTRRVLEVLLMAWRSGYRLREVTRFIRFGEESELRVPICVRDLFARVVIDSTILACFETDSQGAAIQIRYGLLKSLLAHPQTLEAECRHCDSLRPANLLAEPPSENAGCLFNLQLEARLFATKTFVRDALQETSCQAYPAVALCSTLTHWMRIPNVHRIREGWALIVWPVPLQELRPQGETG